jgi:hypothetical protein
MFGANNNTRPALLRIGRKDGKKKGEYGHYVSSKRESVAKW